MKRKRIRVGVGAGMSDDRIAPGVELLERGNLDYLVCECLAERTIARETLERLKDPSKGYAPSMHERMEAFLPLALSGGVRIVTNMGAANPAAAGHELVRAAADWGHPGTSCAVIQGDDVTELLRRLPGLQLMESGEPLEAILPRMASANAYLGADAVVTALDTGAPVVMAGRVADPSLFLGPMMHEFGWDTNDLPRLAAGTVTGHLLECSGQLTGGCFADPGMKDVEDLAGLGYPFADISVDGEVSLGKTPGSGGRLDVATCTEQLLYEIHDPAAYVTPDCVLDVTGIRFQELGTNQIAFSGARARPRTLTYKVSVGFFEGYSGSGEMGFAGPNALARAKLGAEVVKERLRRRGLNFDEMRVDFIGIDSLHGPGATTRPEPYEIRLRVAARSESRKAAEAVGAEVRGLHMQGPFGAGGGINFGAKQVIAVQSVLLPRHLVRTGVLLVKGVSR